MAWLVGHWPDHRLEQDGGHPAVVLPGFRLPAGFEPQVVDLLLLVPFGYPDAPLDMFWVDPFVSLRGAAPQATCADVHLGKTWQRFSRHLPRGVWRPGSDGVQSYIALITTMLTREAGPTARAA